MRSRALSLTAAARSGGCRWLRHIDDDAVLAQHAGQLVERAGERSLRVGTGQLHRSPRRRQQGEALRCGETQRLGEQPRHTGEDNAFVDEHVDHLVDERRQPTHRRKFEIAHQFGLA